MFRIIIAIPLITHGVAHISDFIAAWASGGKELSPKPWIFPSDFTLSRTGIRAYALLWLFAALCFACAGLAILFGQVWFPTIAIIGAVLSLLAIVPWWNTVQFSAKTGAIFDMIVLLVLFSPLREKLIELLH